MLWCTFRLVSRAQWVGACLDPVFAVRFLFPRLVNSTIICQLTFTCGLTFCACGLLTRRTACTRHECFWIGRLAFCVKPSCKHGSSGQVDNGHEILHCRPNSNLTWRVIERCIRLPRREQRWRWCEQKQLGHVASWKEVY